MESGLIAVGIRRLNDLLEDDIDRRKKKENVSDVVLVRCQDEKENVQ